MIKYLLIFITLIILIALLAIYLSHNSYYSGLKTDHFDGKAFFNPGKPMNMGFLDLLKWKFNSTKPIWPEQVEDGIKAKPIDRVYSHDLVVTYVGHVTFLIQTEGLNILTDPVWSERASPVSWAGPKRIQEPGIVFEDLPKIDLVLVSHNHYDHLDLYTIEKLWQRDKPTIITPLGNDTIIKGYNKNIEVKAHDWGDHIKVKDGISIHLDPMHHWSARGLFDRNHALWAAFTLTSPHGNIYFIGDSGYGNGDYFKAAKGKYGSYRLALLPIGAYEPRWFMQYAHMNPAEAIQAYYDLGEPLTIASHFDVFQLADDKYGQAISDFNAAKKKFNAKNFIYLKVGENIKH